MRAYNISVVLVSVMLSMLIEGNQAQAATSVGKAIISIGKVFTTNKEGVETKLKRRGKVFEGDTIKVGKKSRLQLRFIDNQLVVLKANTVFRIDEYKFKDKNDNNKSAALTLLKGGMRSVTGLIGKSARDKYKVRTPVATMGVRGTHYILQVCNSDCGDGVQGLVGTVLEGEIEMTNDGGTSTFGTDQFFNVPSSNDAPKTMTNPPSVLISRSETESNKEDKEDNKQAKGKNNKNKNAKGPAKTGRAKNIKLSKLSTSGKEADKQIVAKFSRKNGTRRQGPRRPPPPQINPNLDPNKTVVGFIVGSDAPDKALLVFSGLNNTTKFPVAGGGVQGFNGTTIKIAAVNGVNNQPVAANIIGPSVTTSYAVYSNGVSIEQGGDPLGVNWGRWLSTDIVAKQDGSDADLITGLAYVYSPNLTPITTIGNLSSTATYNTVGGPSIRDETGAIVTGSLALGIDFNSPGTITSFGGTLSGNGRTYSVSLDTPGAFPLLAFLTGDNVPILANCTGCPDMITLLIGQTGGSFVGPGAEGFIGSFGLFGVGFTGQRVGLSGSRFFKAVVPPM